MCQQNRFLSSSGLHDACKPPIEDCHVLKVAHERTRSLPLTGEEKNLSVSNELRSMIEKRTSINLSLERVRSKVQHTDAAHYPPSQCKTSQKCQTLWGRRASTGCRVVKWLPSYNCCTYLDAITNDGLAPTCSVECTYFFILYI